MPKVSKWYNEISVDYCMHAKYLGCVLFRKHVAYHCYRCTEKEISLTKLKRRKKSTDEI